jgi:hypothetical protein
MDFCSLNNSSKKNSYQCNLFSIGYYNKENYVATLFSFLKKRRIKWLGVFFFSLDLGGHPIPFTTQAKKKRNKIDFGLRKI